MSMHEREFHFKGIFADHGTEVVDNFFASTIRPQRLGEYLNFSRGLDKSDSISDVVESYIGS